MKILKRIHLLLLALIFCAGTAYAQTTISGTIKDESGEPLVGVNIALKGKVIGTISDWDGNFELTISSGLPVVLEVSIIGFETQVITVDGSTTMPMNVELAEQIYMTDEVVVSASRFEQSILESPVTIEKMDILDIRSAAAEDFYGALINLKGIDINTQSLGFKQLSLRSFNESGNTRVVQLIDGMDNQAPGLNFPVGNLFGIPELDLESVEVLPGASSALYGPNAITGIVLMNSKSPFEYQGLSAQVKVGVNHIDGVDTDPTPLQEYGIRYAKSFNNKVAFKVNAHYMLAEDWRAEDLRNRALDGTTRETNPGINTVNGYGDDFSVPLPLGPGGTPVPVSRTYFTEEQLVDLDVENLKLNGAIHWRPSDNIELIAQANYGKASTMYAGADRYYLDGMTFQQYKLEAKADNFYVRGYRTIENLGDSYGLSATGGIINEIYNPSVSNPATFEGWFNDYAIGYFTAQAGGANDQDSHAAARAAADANLLAAPPGSAQFQSILDQVRSTSYRDGGSKLVDNTSMNSFEGMYNFENEIDFISVIVGGNVRTVNLQSDQVIFALDDNGEEFSITEWGSYIQLNKALADEKLNLTGSIRYDKNQNFDGRFTPRISAVYTLAEKHNFRVSYQTGFKMPTSQFQYIDFATPSFRLIGGLPFLRDRYNFNTNPVYDPATYGAWRGTFLAEQAANLAAGQDLATATANAEATALPILQGSEFQFEEFKLETSKTYEIGYKTLIDNRFLIDAYYYNSSFTNFSTIVALVQSSTTEGDSDGLLTPNNFQTVISSPVVLNSYGWALGVNYSFGKGYNLGGNFSYNKLTNRDELPSGFLSGFNTPETKFNLNFHNREVIDNLGFKVAYRWQDEFLWESPFAVGPVDAFGTVDIQLSYKLENLKTIAKLGSSNLFNNRYTNSFGNPTIGQVIYLSLTYDQFFN